MQKKTNSIVATIIAILGIVAVSSPAFAVPKGSFVNPVSDVAWIEVLPIRFGGFTIMDADVYSTPDYSRIPYCQCPMAIPPYWRIGLPISLYEAARAGEATKDAMYFPTFNLNLGLKKAMGAMTSPPSTGTQAQFYNAHWFIFPIWYTLGLFLDAACLEAEAPDLAFMTEILPGWSDDSLGSLLHPESVLFANPIAQMACAVDAIASNFWRPLDFMFWCIGGKSAYPFSGFMQDSSEIQVGFDVVTRQMYTMSRLMMMWDYATNVCSPIPTPIWIKGHQKNQRTRPTVQKTAHPVGTSAWKYQFLANLPSGKGSADNYSFINFRKRWCCVL